MFRWVKHIMRKGVNAPKVFIDPALGTFQFEKRLGWRRRIRLDNVHDVDIILGSDGEPPSQEMLRTVGTFIDKWSLLRQVICDYVRIKLRTEEWVSEPKLPDPDELVVISIAVLWRDNPHVSLIEFEAFGDDRVWHVTCSGDKPVAFAYDH